jgi:hypothetical protein
MDSAVRGQGGEAAKLEARAFNLFKFAVYYFVDNRWLVNLHQGLLRVSGASLVHF